MYFAVTRQDLPALPERAFLLHGLLSKEECAYYIKATQTAGYRSLEDVSVFNLIDWPRCIRCISFLILLIIFIFCSPDVPASISE